VADTETGRVVAVVVTHRRVELLAASLAELASQSRPVDHLVVVDNGNEAAVADLVARQTVPSTYIGSQHNLGGAGGFALGILHALALGADWVWCADDDGRPEGPEVLDTLLRCAVSGGYDELSPVVVNIDDADTLAFPLRRGLVWRRRRSELFEPGEDPASQEVLDGIASLMNGALFSARAIEAVGVPDLRLFVRGDEVEMHRRLARSGLRFGTCLTTAYLHPDGTAEFRPILGGRMHTQYPDDATKRYYTYRNRGWLLHQPGLRKLIPQEYARFGWYFIVQQRDPRGFAEWVSLRRQGRRERFAQAAPHR
jgi:rhamnopyranosyl-N-acetylglucosaminyl-diphospho-decaprenol beta-1,3/1,4-galactofuranosyltransferase